MDKRDLEIKRFETQLRQLRLTFELYFQGIERRSPEIQRNQFHKELLRFQSTSSDWPTALRYRIKAMVQSFTSYDQKWRRELTAIEKGTSRRDRLRAVQQKSATATPLSIPAPMTSPHEQNLDKQRLEKLYKAYVQARQMAGQKTSLTFENLAKKLRTQLPALQKKHPGKNIDFRVVVQNGKAQLKAVVK